ncbi:Alkanal monooxygenase beta chain [BD1-7 clade bacterium]|uniref:Alkanal monooxygenase beta chain n=1 Tax=BD1-7 clade bacterium TaxID=2029982 RepID=A0A5S9NPH5_9GAMM|nr:Alkanal monooxygenase beta chain [BD1-7 clade bacterium]
MEDTHTTSLIFHTRRYPSSETASSNQLHHEMHQMIRWADSKLNFCAFSEHHISNDGFMSSPMLASALAVGCTNKLLIRNAAVLAPLHDPLEIAEQITMLDLLSGGRVKTILALGYRECEYQLFDVDWEHRGQVFNEKLEVILQLLNGETVSYHGLEIKLEHLPVSPINEIVGIGGNSRPAARRAARAGLDYHPAFHCADTEVEYHALCNKQKVDGRYYAPADKLSFLLIHEDPDKVWHEHGKFMLFDAMSYQNISHTSRVSCRECDAETVQGLRESGAYSVLTPDEAIKHFNTDNSMVINPLVGGMHPDIGWNTLELYHSKVYPAIVSQLDRDGFDAVTH